jgi:tetratricopeptide (TPR) repeat protein
MKRKYKIIIALACMMPVGLVGGYYGARQILIMRIASWRASGIAASKSGDNFTAADLLARYLRRRPGDVDALEYYAHSRELAEEPNGQHLTETAIALKSILGLDPDRLDDRRHLLDLYVRMENRPQALDTANAILAKHPKDVRTLRIKTEMLVGLRQYRAAYDYAQAWSTLAPLDLQAHLNRLRIRALLAQTPGAILADAAALRAIHPDDPKFELIQGYAEILAGDLAGGGEETRKYEADAITWLKTAAAHPNLPDEIATVLVEQFDRVGQSNESLAIMQTAAKSGQNPAMKEALAKRCWELGRWEETVATLSDLDLSSSSSDATLIAFKAIAAERIGKKDDAERCRAALASRSTAAAKVWTELLRRFSAVQATTNPTAIATAVAGITDPAAEKLFITNCRSALAVNPDNVYIRYYFGDAEARVGETELAIQAWRSAASTNLTWPTPCVRLVDTLIQRGRSQEALVVATTAARRGSTQAAVAVSLARAWAAGVEDGTVAHSDELLKLVNQIQSDLPDDEQTLLIRIMLTARKGIKSPPDHDAAVALVRSAIDRKPPLTEPMLVSLASVSQKYHMNLADECFAKSLKLYGASPLLAYHQATARFSSGNAQDGLKIFDDLAARSGKSSDVSWKLARANYLDITGLPDAPAAWKSLAKEFPNDFTVQKAIVSARAVRGDWAVVDPAIDRLKAIAPDPGLEWRLARARLMIESPRNDSDYEQASLLLDGVIKQFPSLAEPEALLARALVQMKRTDAALEHYSKSVQKDPTSVPIALQYASLLQSSGDFDRVTGELDRIAPNLRTQAERHQAAILLAQQGKAEQATKLLEQDANSDTPAATTADDQILLATLYAQQRKYDKVDPIINQLLAHPTLPGIRFATSYYTARGQSDKAIKTLGLLDTIKLDPGYKEMILASYYIQNGDAIKGDQLYAAATKVALTSAIAWRLHAGLQLALGHTADSMSTLADALKALPNDESFKALAAQNALIRQSADDPGARSIVIAAIRDPQGTAPGLELLQIVSAWRSSNDAERAATQIQQFISRNPNFLPARMQLVSCYGSMNRVDDATTTAQQAMAAFPSDPEPARVAVEVSAAAGRWQTMRQLADLWRKRTTGNPILPDTAIAQADLAIRDYSSVTQRLLPYVPMAYASPDSPTNANILMFYTVAAINQDQKPPLIEKLWQLAATTPEWRLRWIRMATDINDSAAAVAWLDRAAAIITTTTGPDFLILAQSYDSISETRQYDDATHRASDLFAKLVASKDATGEALLWAAAHAERLGDLTSAESLYRRALAASPNLWIAQNNLAVLLARRGEHLDDARSLATSVVEKHPHVATLRDSLALVQSKSGDLPGAIQTITIAIKLEPDNPAWRVRLAGYQLAAGNRADATKTLAEVDDRRLDLRKLAPDVKSQLDTLRKSLRASAGA